MLSDFSSTPQRLGEWGGLDTFLKKPSNPVTSCNARENLDHRNDLNQVIWVINFFIYSWYRFALLNLKIMEFENKLEEKFKRTNLKIVRVMSFKMVAIDSILVFIGYGTSMYVLFQEMNQVNLQVSR